MFKAIRNAGALFVPILLATVISQAEGPAPKKMVLSNFSVVDLTHVLKPGIPVYPGGEPFQITKLADISQGYYLNKISLGEHTGTHVDAPNHFVKGAQAIDALPLDRLIGPLVVIDVEKAAAANPDHEVSLQEIRAWETKHTMIPPKAFVVARTGWAKKWNAAKEYVNLGDDKAAHFPGFSAAAAKYLVEERKIAGLGIDTLSADPGNSKEFPVHKLVLKSGAVNLENLANLDRVPAHGATLVVAPLRIDGGSGAPARVFAFVPK